MSDQLCPLCGNPATYEIFHDPYCKHFTCQTCVEFCIDERAEGYLRTVPQEFRTKLSGRASATGPGRMFVMRGPTPAEDPKAVLIAESISRIG